MIRPITADDVPRVAEIHVSAWRQAYKGLISDAYLFGAMGMWRSHERFMEQARSDPGACLVCLDPADGLLKGFALHRPARDPADAGCHDLVALYVQPEFQGQGVGTRLVRAVESGLVLAAPDTPLVIWALEQNRPAHGFYRHCGYVPDGRRKFDSSLQIWEVRFSRPCSQPAVGAPLCIGGKP